MLGSQYLERVPEEQDFIQHGAESSSEDLLNDEDHIDHEHGHDVRSYLANNPLGENVWVMHLPNNDFWAEEVPKEKEKRFLFRVSDGNVFRSSIPNAKKAYKEYIQNNRKKAPRTHKTKYRLPKNGQPYKRVPKAKSPMKEYYFFEKEQVMVVKQFKWMDSEWSYTTSNGEVFRSSKNNPKDAGRKFLDEKKYEREKLNAKYGIYVTPHGSFRKMTAHFVNFGMASPRHRYIHQESGEQFPSHEECVEDFYEKEWKRNFLTKGEPLPDCIEADDGDMEEMEEEMNSKTGLNLYKKSIAKTGLF